MAPGADKRGPFVVSMGEILFDLIGSPAVVDVAESEMFTPKPGGAPANVAVGVARLGTPSAFIGMVGDDAFGRKLRRVLDENGVDTRSLATSLNQPTTLAFVAMDKKGVPSYSFYRHPGADLSLKPADVDDVVFADARVFHFGSLSLVRPPAYDATLHCLQNAKRSRMFVTYDPNYRPALWSKPEAAREKMLELMGGVTLCKVSEEELAFLTGIDAIKPACETLAARGPRMIVVTLGDAGIVGWMQGETFNVSGEPVKVVDTTGCGDASMAGVITHLLERAPGLRENTQIEPEDFEAALRFGNRCGAITATRPGAIPALPRRSEVAV